MKNKKRVQAPSTPTIFSDIDLEQKIDSVLYYYSKNYPEECEMFVEYIKERRRSLYNANGTSIDGLFSEKASVPNTVFMAMVRYFGRNWTSNDRLAKKWWSRAKIFCVNENSIPTIRVAEDYRSDEELPDGAML